MARSPRITNPEEPTVYHLMSRTTLLGFPIEDEEKDYFVQLVRRFSNIYLADFLGFCCMGNHFHLLVRMLPHKDFSDDNIRQRFEYCYGAKRKLLDSQIPFFRETWSDLSRLMKDIKLGFTRYFNRKHDHKGYFWGDRFKSVIIEDGDALLNCLAYIDLNPVRAGLVEKPEDYRWSSIGWHVQTGNRGGFLSNELGMRGDQKLNKNKRLMRYRQFLYGIWALDAESDSAPTSGILEEERKRDFMLPRVSLFRFRSKYFTDSVIIGSRKFVADIYRSVKHRLPTKREKVPHQVEGLEGIFSLNKFSGQRQQ